MWTSVPGKSAESRLIRLVAGIDQKFMPPMGEPTSPPKRSDCCVPGSIRVLEWTARAPHWSFQKIQRPPVPDVRARAWVRNLIDDFILARLECENVAPSPEARTTLLRRVSLDLTGLPPTPEQVGSSPTTVPMLTSAWSIACSPRRTTARSGPVTGSIWPATPIATATRRIVPARGPGAIATG